MRNKQAGNINIKILVVFIAITLLMIVGLKIYNKYDIENKLKYDLIDSYVESCTTNGNSKNVCNCEVRSMIDKLSLEGYVKMMDTFEKEGRNSPEVNHYLEMMVEETAKCRK